MITVSIGGKDVVIKPKTLLSYVEKVDFIKMRRGAPWDLIQGFPPEISNHEENYKTLVRCAMETVYKNSSSVSLEEEILFDRSEEGFFYDFWRCIPKMKVPFKSKEGGAQKFRAETPMEGIDRSKAIWESGTAEERQSIRFAMEATNEAHNLKNSDGPSDQ
jgi:hypothetical protein